MYRIQRSLCILAAAAWPAVALPADNAYSQMAPLEQYLMPADAEIALARSAAPASISSHAAVLVLDRKGYRTAVEGDNGFACIVERSWATGADDPEFWNPRMRAPICFNAPAVRSFLPFTLKRTEWVLAGESKAGMFARLSAALDRKELPSPEPGSMCYMMSRQGYLNDRAGPWRPHLMFFTPLTEAAAWGADLPGSPVMASRDAEDRLTVFMVPVGHWSDGSAAPGAGMQETK